MGSARATRSDGLEPPLQSQFHKRKSTVHSASLQHRVGGPSVIKRGRTGNVKRASHATCLEPRQKLEPLCYPKRQS
ncbi:hypothetical protein NDU88_004672 [Pleurodeles waltl]|uniref:Uncharacterized protein n=1 Tax=Pleurodeles waltl TaxID=8319 RepID=A0AAV7T9G2_PLEWA|nr:hypothetical protein NDU88_004672 [Pleurodeles waltl]